MSTKACKKKGEGVSAMKRWLESWRITWEFFREDWTKKDTAELAVSAVSGVVGSLLGLKLFGVI